MKYLKTYEELETRKKSIFIKCNNLTETLDAIHKIKRKLPGIHTQIEERDIEREPMPVYLDILFTDKGFDNKTVYLEMTDDYNVYIEWQKEDEKDGLSIIDLDYSQLGDLDEYLEATKFGLL